MSDLVMFHFDHPFGLEEFGERADSKGCSGMILHDLHQIQLRVLVDRLETRWLTQQLLIHYAVATDIAGTPLTVLAVE